MIYQVFGGPKKVIRTKHLRDKVSICRKAIKACHRHWHRSSYAEVPATCKYAHLPNSEHIFARVVADQLGTTDSRVLDVTPGSRPVSRPSRGSRETRISRGSRLSREPSLSRVSRETFINYVTVNLNLSVLGFSSKSFYVKSKSFVFQTVPDTCHFHHGSWQCEFQ